MHAEEPTVYCLPVHLPDQQQVYFDLDDALDEIVDHVSTQNTTLTAWVKANAEDLQGLSGKHARDVSY